MDEDQILPAVAVRVRRHGVQGEPERAVRLGGEDRPRSLARAVLAKEEQAEALAGQEADLLEGGGREGRGAIHAKIAPVRDQPLAFG